MKTNLQQAVLIGVSVSPLRGTSICWGLLTHVMKCILTGKDMDCKDLTICDYVIHNGSIKIIDAVYLYSVSVHEPSKPWGVAKSELVSVDDIEPIPIYGDFFVKNGFVGVELTDSYELNTDYYEIEVWNYSDGLWVVNVHWIEFSSTPESKATVSYVHQLQHLLRLCGIEKEIEL